MSRRNAAFMHTELYCILIHTGTYTHNDICIGFLCSYAIHSIVSGQAIQSIN